MLDVEADRAGAGEDEHELERVEVVCRCELARDPLVEHVQAVDLGQLAAEPARQLQ
jgi:hypothetical protein